MIEEIMANLAFAAIKAGVRIPRQELVEHFSKWCYLKSLLAQLRINCVIDVGANRGQFARNLRRSGYRGHIFSFEPNRDDFVKLASMSATDKLWDVFQIALGNENTQRQFNVTKTTLFNSFLDPKTTNAVNFVTGMDVVLTETVEMKRLDSIIGGLLEPVSQAPRVFLKLDTQGFDLEVLKGAKNCIGTIVGLQSEVSVIPIYENMPHYVDALNYYESLGFSLMNLFVINRTKQQCILEYDCLMARADEMLPKR